MSSLELAKDNENIQDDVKATPEIVDEQITEDLPEETTASMAENNYSTLTEEQLLDALKELTEKDVEVIKDEVEQVKQLFYKKIKLINDEAKDRFTEAGGADIDFVAPKSELEEEFKNTLAIFKSKKAALTARVEAEKEENLLQKQHVLEQMKGLVDNNNDVSSHIPEFKALQLKWKTIGIVPAQNNTEIIKQYNLLQEKFWDLVKINNELREYDFKKNLEAKTQICETAEKLAAEEDVVNAFQTLQKLHDEWHDLGPVSREFRELIWNRFKEASTSINKKYQAHFDDIRKMEDENGAAKEALCEKIEAIDISELNTLKKWDDVSKTLATYHDEWKSIGFAPRKVNQKLFERYRKACDSFYTAKAEYFKTVKAGFSESLERKKQLCEKAEVLKDSTDWKKATDEFVQLQKDWKSSGVAPKKMTDDIWKRFISACDYFFEQKNKTLSGQYGAEVENMEKKKAVIEKIKALGNTPNAQNDLRTLMGEWNEIGHVPYKEKDKMHVEYRQAVDAAFEVLNIDASQRRLNTFKNNLKDMSNKGENKLFREREKLMRAYEHLKAEIATYENNIGFFSSSSKKANTMIKEMERKIESLKEECKLIEQKINMIEDSIS